MVREHGPAPLREVAESLDASRFAEAIEVYRSGQDRFSTSSFFARVALQRETACGTASRDESAPSRVCPYCSHPPQSAVLTAQGDGSALTLACSLCLREWPFARRRCANCGESGAGRLIHFAATESPHLEVRACGACGVYQNLCRRDKDQEVVPDVDEIAALPLDVWARQQGFRKLFPNLVGM